MGTGVHTYDSPGGECGEELIIAWGPHSDAGFHTSRLSAGKVTLKKCIPARGASPLKHMVLTYFIDSPLSQRRGGYFF